MLITVICSKARDVLFCLWFKQLPQAVLIPSVPVDTCGLCYPLACAASRSQVDGHDRCYHKRPY